MVSLGVKITYIMHVDWRWIKQRPHFIAEGLARNHEVTVFYQFRYQSRGFQNNAAKGVKLKPMFVIPRGDRVGTLRKVNQRIKKWIFQRHLKREQSDWIYMTYPNQIRLLPKDYFGNILYDCMDDHIAFLSDIAEKELLEKEESELVRRANHIVVSSEKLKAVLLERYGNSVEEKITIVRNAFNGEIVESHTVDNIPLEQGDRQFKIVYFGTVSGWFDFDVLLKSAEDFPNIQFRLYGPVDGVEIPVSPNIEHLGTIEHDDLLGVAADADCFIMPFLVNEITEAVDPVKLYEYINFQKNIVCVEYPEIKRFEPFVYFYSDYASFKQQIEKLLGCNALKYAQQQRLQFLRDNDWESRIETIESLLGNA